MRKTLIGIAAVPLGVMQALAQGGIVGSPGVVWSSGSIDEPMSGGGGAGGSASTSTAESGPVTEEQVRLLLQAVVDVGGTANQWYSPLTAAREAAIAAGLLKHNFPVVSTTSEVTGGVSVGTGAGVSTFSITEAGRKRLAELTKAAPNPTRLAYTKSYIVGVGWTIYGAPVEVPLGDPFHIEYGCAVVVGR